MVPPTSVELKTKYFLNKNWIEKWKIYVDDPNENSPGPINNKDLIDGKRDSQISEIERMLYYKAINCS